MSRGVYRKRFKYKPRPQLRVQLYPVAAAPGGTPMLAGTRGALIGGALTGGRLVR